jgi:hypothetical protein
MGITKEKWDSGNWLSWLPGIAAVPTFGLSLLETEIGEDLIGVDYSRRAGRKEAAVENRVLS